MHFRSVNVLLLYSAAAFVVSAYPTTGDINGTDHSLLSRQSSDFDCEGTFYSSSFIAKTFAYAQDWEVTGCTAAAQMGSSSKPFPHDFNNNEAFNFPDCPGIPAPFREWPILKDMSYFAPARYSGDERIVYKITSFDPQTGRPDNFAFCGLITHTNAPQGGFNLCMGA